MIAARLQIPLEANGKLPAVILMHGTSGLSYRGVYYAAALNRAGIATLEIDQWGGRNLPGGSSSRPKNLYDNLPDIVGAYRLLAARPNIDASRIGILGSSMGGIESLLMMTHRHSDALLGDQVHLKAAVRPHHRSSPASLPLHEIPSYRRPSGFGSSIPPFLHST
jgi:dienelactone hydrolase